jgi:ribonuclease P protein component
LQAEVPHGQDLPRTQRLKNSNEFKHVFQKRRKIATRYGAFHVCNNGLEYARLGITVSRKVSKRAVERNRIKRAVREYFRKNKTSMTGMDIVFTAFPGCAGLGNQDIRLVIEGLWKRTESRCAR